MIFNWELYKNDVLCKKFVYDKIYIDLQNSIADQKIVLE